jgi:hypothetical protein
MPYTARPNKPILLKRLGLQPGVPLSRYLEKRGLGRYRGVGGRRGLGDATTDSALAEQADYGTAAPTPTIIAPPSAPSPFTTALAQSLPGLLSAWTTIGGRVIAPTVQYQGPGGVSYSAPAGSAAAGSLPLSLGSSSSMSLLLMGGAALLLVMFMAKK